MTGDSLPSFCLVGAGRMGARHANVVAMHPGATLETVVDADAETATKVADEYAAEWSTDPSMALESADACIVSTPEKTHASLVERALAADCHVLLEKPIAHDLEDAHRIVDAWGRHDRCVLVGHVLRFDPRYRRVRSAIDDGDLGELVSVNVRRSLSSHLLETISPAVNPLVQTAIHEIDVVNWYYGTEPKTVYATTVRGDDGRPQSVTAIVGFDRGNATIETSFLRPDDALTPLRARTEVTGTSGTATIELPDRSCRFVGGDRPTEDLFLWPAIDGRIRGSLEIQFDHFLSCLRGAMPLVTPDEATASLATATAILESATQERELSNDEFGSFGGHR